MMGQLAHLVGKNLSMGIDAETASVSELTPQQLVLAATSALNRGIEVRRALLCPKKMEPRHASPRVLCSLQPQPCTHDPVLL